MANISSNDGRKDLEAEIKKLEQVDLSVPQSSLPQAELKTLTYSAPTDADLLKTAENGLVDYKRNGIESIKSNSEENAKALDLKKTNYMVDMAGEIDALDADYKAASNNIDNDVLKRGLARSSVAVNQKSELENSYMNQAASVRESYRAKITEIDKEISEIDQKLKAALNDFNLSYAIKLNDSLNSLKAEREKKQNEVIKYNNEIAKAQAELDANRLKAEGDIYGKALDNKKKATDVGSLTDKQRDELYNSVYDKMDEFLGSLSAEEAKIEIRNHSMYRSHLNDFYYYKLYDKYGR